MAIEEVCEIRIGRTPPRNTTRFWNGNRPWLSIGDMAQGRDLQATKECITDDAVTELNLVPAQAGTVLMSFKLSIGKLGIAGRDLYTNEAIAHLPVRDRSRLDERYLMWALERVDLAGKSDRAVMGATLNMAKIRAIEIPLPPIAEQRRIAEILHLADSARSLRTRSLELAGSLDLAMFTHMFGRRDAQRLVELRDLGRITTGKTPPSTRPGMVGHQVAFITPGDLESNERPARWLSTEGAAASKVVRAGAALVCCIGATIGKVGVARNPSAFNQQINAVEWGDQILDAYGAVALRHLKPIIRARGASTTLPLLKKSSFERLKIPVPSLDDQREFTLRVEAASSRRELMRRHQSALDELFVAIMNRAFQGGVVAAELSAGGVQGEG